MTLTALCHACRCGALLVQEEAGDAWRCPRLPGPLDEPAPTGLSADGRTVTMPANEWRHTQGVPHALVAAKKGT